MVAICALCGDQAAQATVFPALLTIRAKENYSGAQTKCVLASVNTPRSCPMAWRQVLVIGNSLPRGRPVIAVASFHPEGLGFFVSNPFQKPPNERTCQAPSDDLQVVLVADLRETPWVALCGSSMLKQLRQGPSWDLRRSRCSAARRATLSDRNGCESCCDGRFEFSFWTRPRWCCLRALPLLK